MTETPKQHYQPGQIILGHFNGETSGGWVVISDTAKEFGTKQVRRLILEKEGKKYEAFYSYGQGIDYI